MDKAIVAGSNGLVGSAVVTRLLSYGIEVLSLGRKKSKNSIGSDSYLEIDMIILFDAFVPKTFFFP
jgi:nucleoside-diphosphate-sugar epimerase